MVIVPIYWNRNIEDKEEVLAAARKMERQLAAMGVVVAVELDDSLMPGQRFKLWYGKDTYWKG